METQKELWMNFDKVQEDFFEFRKQQVAQLSENLQEKQRLAQKEEQQESAPTLTKISETDKEKQDQEGDMSEDKKQLTI